MKNNIDAAILMMIISFWFGVATMAMVAVTLI